MAKNKKKDKNVLVSLDNSLDNKYENLLREIQFYQASIKRADKKGKEEAKKKLKKKNDFYNFSYEINKRKEVIENMESRNLFDKIEDTIKSLKPICKMIARMTASLVLLILSLDVVKKHIKPQTLQKLTNLYNIAMQF